MDKSKIKIIFFVIAFTGSFFFAFGNKTGNIEKDPFLDYLYKMNQHQGYDSLSAMLGKAYDKLGFRDKSMELLLVIKRQEEKFFYLKDILSSNAIYYYEYRNLILQHIESLDDEYYQIVLFIEMLKNYFLNKQDSRAIEIYRQIRSQLDAFEIKAMEDIDTYCYLIDFYTFLYSTSLKDDSDTFFQKMNNSLLEKTKNMDDTLSLFLSIIYGFVENKQEYKAPEYTQKFYNIILRKENFKFNDLSIINCFMIVRDYDSAAGLVKFILNNRDKSFSWNLSNPSTLSLSILSSYDPELKMLLMNELENMEEWGVEFLIDINEIKKAKEFAEKMDSKKKVNDFSDCYYYSLGRKYLFNGDLLIARLLAGEIKNDNKKFSLCFDIARKSRAMGDEKFFLEILSEIESELRGYNYYLISLNLSLYEIFLEADYVEKVLDLVKKTDKSIPENYFRELFFVTEYYALHGNKNKTLELLNQFNKNSFYRGLILSKLASIEYLNNNKKEAYKLYKNAYNILLENDGFKITGNDEPWNIIYVEDIIEDYLNAKIRGIVKKTDFSED